MNFNKYKISEVGSVITGKTPPTKNEEYFSVEKDKYLFITPRDMNINSKYISETERYLTDFVTDKFSSLIIDNKSICVSCIGTVGKVFIPKQLSITNQQINSITNLKDFCNFDYLYYYLKQNYKKIQSVAGGTTMPIVNKSSFEGIEIELPSLSEQLKIVKILDKIDEKIELNNEINNNLYELCNNLFHEYLDEFECKIEYKKIVEVAKKVVTGKTPSTANRDFWDGDIPFITIPDMHNQVFTIKTERNITELGAKSIIPKNSISVSCIATVGLVSINTEDSQTNQQINSIVIENDYDLYFLFEYLSEQEEYMKSIAGGSTTYNINKNTFENIEVPYLPRDVLIEFNNIVSSMFEKIKINQYENERLSQLRDTILPKLMNGEIDLENIEI